ncbi:MAG: hypothetical protein QGH07_16155 [Alphaproteobacteria bacterium]|nr:hypothetical protein [Alphaproteobacteria bacterium]
MASAHDCTVAQVDDIVSTPDTNRRRYLEGNVAAAEIALTASEIESLGAVCPLGVTAGALYPEGQMKWLRV